MYLCMYVSMYVVPTSEILAPLREKIKSPQSRSKSSKAYPGSWQSIASRSCTVPLLEFVTLGPSLMAGSAICGPPRVHDGRIQAAPAASCSKKQEFGKEKLFNVAANSSP